MDYLQSPFESLELTMNGGSLGEAVLGFALIAVGFYLLPKILLLLLSFGGGFLNGSG